MHAWRVLEFDAIRAQLVRHCETGLGAERAAALEPTFETGSVWESLALTEEAHGLLATETLPSMGPVRDHRMALVRASKGGVLGGQELFQIAELLAALRQMRAMLEGRRESAPRLNALAAEFPNEPKLEHTLFESLEPDGEVKDGASDALAQLRKSKRTAAGRILEKIQSYVSGRTREYLSDPLYTVRDGRYVIPVRSEHRAKVKGIVHDTSGSGQTVYIEPEDVLQLGNRLREVEGEEREEVQRILASLSDKVGSVGQMVADALEQAAELDLALGKARLAYAMRAGMPRQGATASIAVDSGRHPLLDPDTVVPVTIEVGRGFQGLLITGPNTGGKTVAIKCVGLFVLMLQSGLFVPARDVEFGPFSQVWADIGDEQSIAQSLSTFSGHIKNIAGALKALRPGALALFDEVGAGTDPAEGAALAKALLRRFVAGGARLIASTHYGELKAFAFSEPGFQNAAMEFDVKSLKPTYRLILGAPGASHALRIAERYGLPQDLIAEAKAALGEQQQDIASMLEKLEQAQRQARQAQSEADRRAAELRKKEELAERKLAEADEIRRNVHAKAQSAIDEALRDLRLEAAEVIERLKKEGGATAAIEKARAELKQIQSRGEAARPKEAPERAAEAPAIAKGMKVRVSGYNQVGVVLETPKSGQALVQVGALKLTLPLHQLSPEQEKGSGRAAVRQNVTLQRALNASTEVSLRGMSAEDASETLQRFLDDAILGGLHQVRIVHGKGEGILRKLTQEALRRNRNVASFRDGEPAEGGHGVTIAVLK